jgi:hypothetical protein
MKAIRYTASHRLAGIWKDVPTCTYLDGLHAEERVCRAAGRWVRVWEWAPGAAGCCYRPGSDLPHACNQPQLTVTPRAGWIKFRVSAHVPGQRGCLNKRKALLPCMHTARGRGQLTRVPTNILTQKYQNCGPYYRIQRSLPWGQGQPVPAFH